MQEIPNLSLCQALIFSQIPQSLKIQMTHLLCILSYHRMVLLTLAPFGDKVLWGDFMPDYQKMYSILFNGITDAINRLQQIQITAEELYMDSEEIPLNIIGAQERDHMKSSAAVSMDAHNHSNKA